MKHLTINSTAYFYWKQAHATRERQRLAAMARGEPAKYGYFKPKQRTAPPVTESPMNDEPDMFFIRFYRLDCTYKQANEAIRNNESPVNLVIDGSETYANALKLPRFTLIRDIKNRWCIYNKLFYKLI